MRLPRTFIAFAALLSATANAVLGQTPERQPWPSSPGDKVVKISGVYPHLAVFNSAGECGIGALVPWAERLWWITYPPHAPAGSDDQLYSIGPDLQHTLHPESVGGTHANRMIHAESNQLIIGPYFIDAAGRVRAADPRVLRARLTATTRHLVDPANRVLFLGMERELYAVDVHSLAVEKIHGEMQGPFPGYHGKGAAVAQGQLIVANNGEKNWDIKTDPHFNGPAGCLAETDGADWTKPFTVVARTNFTEVTGPGGLYGFNRDDPADDRIWALGWDKRSVLLKLLERGAWRTFRLPKGSYTHDALHGWFTEWPRIREVAEGRWLMHMHGLFYEFPRSFSAANAGGLRPFSTHLKMPVDYCAWQGGIAMACADASIMQNPLAGQSHSNLRFLAWNDLENYGPPAGWGGPWLGDAVKSGVPSDPFLVRGFAEGVLQVKNDGADPLTLAIEADAEGRGVWKKIGEIKTPAHGYAHRVLHDEFANTWLRLTPDRDANGVTAYFHLGNAPCAANAELLRSFARAAAGGAAIKPADGDARTLLLATRGGELFSMDGSLDLHPANDDPRAQILLTKFGPVATPITADAASIILTEDGRRFRLPVAAPSLDGARTLREVVTERDLLNAGGTFYEVPRESAGGARRMRPICSHGLAIADFCSWRGLLVLAAALDPNASGEHIVRSADGKAALWLGEVDDLWRFGAPRGVGGPWKDSAVQAGEPSEPYLMTGYHTKSLVLSHDAKEPVTFRVEVDFLADDSWSEYARFTVPPGEPLAHKFPAGYAAHWARLVAERDVKATAVFRYEP